MPIYVEKQENLQSVLEKILESKGRKIEVVVPEYAQIGKGSLSFEIIREFGEKNNKEIKIVTTDRVIFKLAKKAGFLVAEKVGGKNKEDEEEQVEAETVEVKEEEIEEEVVLKEKKEDGIIIRNTYVEEKEKEVQEETESKEKSFDLVQNNQKNKEKVILEKEKTPKKIKKEKKRKFSKVALIFVGLAFLFFIGLGVLVYFVLPKAEVEIYLAGKEFSSEVEVKVDTGAIEINEELKIIPGTVFSVEETGNKTIPTTGKEEVGEKATGILTIKNFTIVETIIPKGTVFIVYQGETGAGLKFIGESGVTVPAGVETVEEEESTITTTVEAGMVEVQVTAEDIGSDYNLKTGTNFLVGTEAYSSFKAANSADFSGGSQEEVSVVAQADLDNLLSQLSAELRQKGEDDLQSKLVGDQKFITKTVKHENLSAVYDKNVGQEGDKVLLNLKTQSRVTVYSESQLKQVVKNSILGSLPEGYFLQDEDLNVIPQLASAEDNGNLTFLAQVSVISYPKINEEEVRVAIKGIKPIEAEAYLKGMDKVLGYNISVWPPLPEKIRRMPFIDSRLTITIEIKSEE